MSEINHEKPEFVPITSGEQLIQIANEMKQYANDNTIDMEVVAEKTRQMLAEGRKDRIRELWPYNRYIKLKGKEVQITCTNDRNMMLQLSASVYDGEFDQRFVQALTEAFWGSDTRVECKQITPRLFAWMKRL